MTTRSIAFITTLIAATAAHCAPMATERFVTNEIAAAIATIPAPDFSTSNAVLVATIEATAPVPGNYAAVSNAAMSALSRAEAEAGFTEWVYTDVSTGVEVIGQPTFVPDVGPDTYWQFQLLVNGSPSSLYLYDNAYATTLRAENEGNDGNISFTATRTRLPTMADLAGKASVADATLTPVYSQTPTFSEWTFSGTSPSSEHHWEVIWDPVSEEYRLFDVPDGQTWESDDVDISESVANADGTLTIVVFPAVGVTATRTRTDIIGYTLGSQSDKPLQPKGDYQPAGDYPTKAEAASPGTVSNIVTKAYVEGLGISSEETDPTIGLTNGTIYVKGSTITPLTGYTESDPTISAWAKAASKPTYTAAEVGATTPEDVTAAIREQSLGGIWDAELEVWWTPRMRNGSLTYEATTNVNLNVEN
jgi:hypothetical protein